MRRGDLRRLCCFLGSAFADDPVMRYCFRRDVTRKRQVAWLQGRGVAHGCLYGTAETTEARDGVAVWFRPGAPSMSVWGGVRSGLVWVPCRLGPAALLRLTRYYATKKELRAARVETDHWYLFLLAVDPRRHGRSIGRRLIEHGLARVDRESQACYLETSREENLSYFERFGFEVHGERVVTDPGGAGPRVWGMVRRPDSGA